MSTPKTSTPNPEQSIADKLDKVLEAKAKAEAAAAKAKASGSKNEAKAKAGKVAEWAKAEKILGKTQGLLERLKSIANKIGETLVKAKDVAVSLYKEGWTDYCRTMQIAKATWQDANAYGRVVGPLLKAVTGWEDSTLSKELSLLRSAAGLPAMDQRRPGKKNKKAKPDAISVVLNSETTSVVFADEEAQEKVYTLLLSLLTGPHSKIVRNAIEAAIERADKNVHRQAAG